MKSLLLDNEDLVKVGYYGLMRFAKQNGLWDDKDERLYFQGQSITVNLIPQALFLLGWIARNYDLQSICIYLLYVPKKRPHVVGIG